MNTRFQGTFAVVLAALCVALAVVDVALVMRARSQDTTIEKLRRQLQAATVEPFREGGAFPPLNMLQSDGQPLDVLQEAGKRRGVVLAIQAASCEHCAEAKPVWRQIAQESGGVLAVFGVELEASASSEDAASEPYPVLRLRSEDFRDFMRRIAGVPMSLAIGKDGVIERIVVGADQREMLEHARMMRQRKH